MEIELSNKRIPFERQKQLDIYYKEKLLEKKYFADLICYDQIIVELKALDQLSGNEISQLLNYLKATGSKLDYSSTLEVRRSLSGRDLSIEFIFYKTHFVFLVDN